MFTNFFFPVFVGTCKSVENGDPQIKSMLHGATSD